MTNKSIVSAFVMAGLFLHSGCNKNTNDEGSISAENQCLKGLLVKRGICGQRVIQVVSGNGTGLSYARQWKDDLSGIHYENVFTVENACAFPTTIKEGETFNFKLTAEVSSDCAHCEAYVPVPNEKNKIVVTSDCPEQ